MAVNLLAGANDAEDEMVAFDKIQSVNASDGRTVVYAASAAGVFQFDPGQFDDLAEGDFLTFEVEYTITDGTGKTSNTATFTVEGVNDAPTAVDDEVIDVPGTSLFIDVLANDFDVDGDSIRISETTNGTYGTVSISGDEVLYLRDTGGPIVFPGDSFTYTIQDPTGEQSTATITIAAETPPPSEVTISKKVSFDGEQGGNGSFDTAQGGRDNDLEIGSGDRTGLVFEDVAIAAGAKIESASLTFTSQRNQGGTSAIEIRLFNQADAIDSSGNGVLTNSGFDTFDFVAFTVTDFWADGAKIETPDLSSLIQQLVDAEPPETDYGTYDLSFSLASLSGIRRIEAEEFGMDVAAELNITYSVDLI